MNLDVMIDKLNLKDLPEMITSYLHQYQVKEFSNLRGYYSKLFDFIGEDVKNSYLNRILKYLSSDTPSVINIIDDFNEGIYDDELMEFSKYLANIINGTEKYIDMYEKLNKNVRFIFYENNDNYCRVKTFHNNREYDKFLFFVIKHSFETYKVNLPRIMGNRLLEEAMTAYYDSDYRKRMVQASAELGNPIAINLHAAHVYRDDPDGSVLLLLKNKNSAGELWQIAFELETNGVSKDTFTIIKNEMKSLIFPNEFTDSISVTERGKTELYERTLLYAFKMYYYVAEKFGFSKAYNSLGKLMIFDFIRVDNDRNKTIKLAKKYLTKAIKMGNINAATNLSVYYYNNKDDESFDFLTTKRLLETSALLGDIKGSCYYGRILIDEGKFDEGERYLKYSAERNSGMACLELGKYYELKCEHELAVENYKKAIIHNTYEAAYNLSVLYLKINAISGMIKVPVDEALYYLRIYKDELPNNIKEKAEQLMNENK